MSRRQNRARPIPAPVLELVKEESEEARVWRLARLCERLYLERPMPTEVYLRLLDAMAGVEATPEECVTEWRIQAAATERGTIMPEPVRIRPGELAEGARRRLGVAEGVYPPHSDPLGPSGSSPGLRSPSGQPMAASGPELPNGWRFEEPPAGSERRGRRGRDYSELMNHPGRWVLLEARRPSSSAANVHQKAAVKRHGGRWQGRTVKNSALTDGKPTWRVYLRYIGPAETEGAA